VIIPSLIVKKLRGRGRGTADPYEVAEDWEGLYPKFQRPIREDVGA